jgi:hypothetical protein
MKIHIQGLVQFLESKFCCVLSCNSEKLECAEDEKRLQNSGLE